ncbi:hypothetical protein [Streptomyces sp. NBC_00038]|uniref:hypothetical protein n=1 Tax=Streptomyces sp. NBC_00038 TaxID=2903615 RepID=UPI00225094C5|nr:hypothetical protein [Streptomyces sp. NBC_00038]MCX5559992.1 hypothetical protein [Streptomyces sp. NBC_00038]
MDLLDWHRGRLSSRRLAVLVKHLPRDSATLHDIHDEAAQWSVTDYLLASVVDQLAEANWMFATVNRDEDEGPLEYPKPVPRPGLRDQSPADGPSAAPPDTRPADNPGAAELAQFFA